MKASVTAVVAVFLLTVAGSLPMQAQSLQWTIFGELDTARHMFQAVPLGNGRILVMGGRVIGDILALEILQTWLDTPFDGGRHQRRLDMFDQL